DAVSGRNTGNEVARSAFGVFGTVRASSKPRQLLADGDAHEMGDVFSVPGSGGFRSPAPGGRREPLHQLVLGGLDGAGAAEDEGVGRPDPPAVRPGHG